MRNRIVRNIFGKGSPEADLSVSDLREISEAALSPIPENSRVLAIIPDKTRDDVTHLLFPIAAEILAPKKTKKFDALVAQGTHAPMSEAEKLAKIGVKNLSEIPNLGQVFDHNWDKPDDLFAIGKLDAETIGQITGGIISQEITLTINKLLAPGNYDFVLIFGGVMPHEVAGFAGGAKYFFPGVSGAELTHATHWLGALVGIENTIGRIETPTRRLIEAAADFISAKVISFSTVTSRDKNNKLQTHALFAGDFRLALRRAAEISRRVHIKYTGRKFRRVVALLDAHYDELWTGGKASYKLGAIIEEGGELIIYAPHLRCISDTHGAMIERYGYAPLETVRKLVAESGEMQANLCVAAHLAHVAFAGRLDERGEISNRYKITLASKINEETCRRVNLGFLDFHKFHLENYQNHPDTLIVKRAGQDLYLIEPFEE
ncbi:MAG TPA: lactate racemase domain-containing protein [Pyrinomonadaceae bacterium]|nr:lactate racemase domain-containing protein [Pyrinomonadaceae bacterium]